MNQSDSESSTRTTGTGFLGCSLSVVLFIFPNIALKNMALNFLLGGVPGMLSSNSSDSSKLMETVSLLFCSLFFCCIALSFPDRTFIPKK